MRPIPPSLSRTVVRRYRLSDCRCSRYINPEKCRMKGLMKIHIANCMVIVSLLAFPKISAAQVNESAGKGALKNPAEEYDNPPAYIYRLETGPRMISPFGPFVSYQANVDANG